MNVILKDGVWFIETNGMNVLKNQVFNSEKDANEMLERINKQKDKDNA